MQEAKPHRKRAPTVLVIRRPNGAHDELCGRSHVPKSHATLALFDAGVGGGPKSGRNSFIVTLGCRLVVELHRETMLHGEGAKFVNEGKANSGV